MTDLVWVTSLFTTGDDGVIGDSARLQNRRVNDGAQLLRRERIVPVDQPPVAPHLRILERLNSFSQANFGHHQRAADPFDFLRRLASTLRKEGAALALYFDFQFPQFFGQAERETA